ncbi:zinc transporter [Vairimorpha necatrix]|uniref:Zinc transporter n=1 Tax=Vairimorpha necatrix TaxID=6039 RepID=A0AAX4J8G2_9MICR
MVNKQQDSSCSHLTCSNNADFSKILKVSIIITIFMLIEFWGHYRTNSLSLLADSLHLFVDVMGFGVSLGALYWSKKGANSKMTFGYYRIEIIGSLLSISLIWVAVGYLICEAIHKLVHPKEIDGGMFFAIAVVGFFVNLISIYVLHYDEYSHHLKHKNLNIRAAYIHIIGDLIQSVGVIIAGIFTYFYPKYVIFDILCTISFSVIVLGSTIFVIRDGFYILAEGAPKDIVVDDIKTDILDIENIYKIIDIYVWAISTNRYATMITVLADDLLINDYEKLLQKIKAVLSAKYNIDVVNIQIETPMSHYGQNGFLVDGTCIDIQKSICYDQPLNN